MTLLLNKNTVITIDKDESIDLLIKITIDKMTKPKQQQKSSKDKNVDQILTKVKGEANKNRHSTALEEGVRLMYESAKS